MPIEYEYYNWLVNEALRLTAEYGSYRELYEYLYSRAFYAHMERDRNREADGKELRVNFFRANPWLQDRDVLMAKPCNMLELIVALAIRCEREITYDPDLGDRTGLWIQTMIVNLGLRDEVDGYFNEERCNEIINTFNTRTYRRNGEGGLFVVTQRTEDMRRVEIWCQLCWYLDELMNL